MLFFEKNFGKEFHVAIFLETHQKNGEASPPEILRYANTHSIIEEPTNENESHTGITILLQDDYELLSYQIPLPGRILSIQIKHKSSKETFNIIALYNYQRAIMKKEQVLEVTSAIKSVLQPHSNNILTGDFNFVENDLDRSLKMSPFDIRTTKIWNDEMVATELVDPFRHQNPKKKCGLI